MTADELDRLDRERREADARYNEALTALDRVIVGVNGRELSREDAERIGTALLGFLQQITAFVESKDRVLAGAARESVATLQGALEPVAEIRTKVGVLQRAIETLTRDALGNRQSADSNLPSARNPQPPAPGPHDDYKYVGFEDQFRGPAAAISRAPIPTAPRSSRRASWPSSLHKGRRSEYLACVLGRRKR